VTPTVPNSNAWAGNVPLVIEALDEPSVDVPRKAATACSSSKTT